MIEEKELTKEEKELTKEEEELKKKKEDREKLEKMTVEIFKYQLIDLEETMNNYLSDETKAKARLKCYNYVVEKLEPRIEVRLEKSAGELRKAIDSENPREKMTEILRSEDFLNLNKKNATALAKKLTEREATQTAKEFLFNSVAPTENAAKNACEGLKETLMNKEILAFQKELLSGRKSETGKAKSFVPSAWWNFVNGANYTTDETIEYIADKLGLDKEQKAELLSFNIPESFTPDKAVCDAVAELIGRVNPPITTPDGFLSFCERVDISYDTFRKFNLTTSGKARTSSTATKKIKQYQLFKMVVAFRMGESEAQEFLKKAERSFTMISDLAFLTAITTGYEIIEKKQSEWRKNGGSLPSYKSYDAGHPFYVALIMEYLSPGNLTLVERHTYYRKFQNPYNFKYIKKYGDFDNYTPPCDNETKPVHP